MEILNITKENLETVVQMALAVCAISGSPISASTIAEFIINYYEMDKEGESNA